MQDVGYSGTPLAKKLGFKPGQAAAFVGLPDDLATLEGAEAFARTRAVRTAAELGPDEPYDIVLAAYAERDKLRAGLHCLKAVIQPAGMIWILWPKKASKVATDITEDVVRAEALPLGLVDVKVCAVSEVFSGLKLVIRVSERLKR